jgi:hypothetical protein
LQSDALNLDQIGAEHLHAHHGAKAGLKHDDAGLDRLKPGGQHSGDRRAGLQLLEDFLLGSRTATASV